MNTKDKTHFTKAIQMLEAEKKFFDKKAEEDFRSTGSLIQKIVMEYIFENKIGAENNFKFVKPSGITNTLDKSRSYVSAQFKSEDYALLEKISTINEWPSAVICRMILKDYYNKHKDV